jgi:hypothetical protein
MIAFGFTPSGDAHGHFPSEISTPQRATGLKRSIRPKYRVGVRTSILRLPTESYRRVEREKITFCPYGAADFGRTVGYRE